MKKVSKEMKILLGSILIVFGIFFIYTFVAGSGSSSGGGGQQIFGGKISSTTKCTCPASAGSTAVMISAGGTNAQFSGTYLQTTATKLIGKSQITSNKNIIGNYSGGGTCMLVGDPCTEGPTITKGIITKAITN